MKRFLQAFLLLITTQLTAQSKDEATIRQMLAEQTTCWNRGDIEGFMKTYWENDSLMFTGKSGITYGWKNTLDNYKRGYPDTTAMGKLAFTIITAKPLSAEYFHVTGKWHLQRSIGDLEGYFTLLIRKIKGKWLIIADHSS
jgi:ketosteroid isomerase-like protein